MKEKEKRHEDYPGEIPFPLVFFEKPQHGSTILYRLFLSQSFGMRKI
jgi:hypothetical protein